jgi:hypothetical protein
MKGWSKLKKTAVISAVAFFGLAGLGALTSPPKNNPLPSTRPSSPIVTTPKVKSENTQTQTPAQPEQQSTTPAPAPKQTQQVTTPASASNCDPNYSGACVPIASDVDCGGGSGNGPAYLYGTATVVGVDIYGLDRDGDGIACE